MSYISLIQGPGSLQWVPGLCCFTKVVMKMKPIMWCERCQMAWTNEPKCEHPAIAVGWFEEAEKKDEKSSEK